MQVESEFFRFHIGNIIEIGVVILAYLGYKRESKKDALDRETVRQNQAVLHKENSLKLESIIDFNKAQADINKQRDIQIGLLSTQTAQLSAMAHGFERRLVMLENNN